MRLPVDTEIPGPLYSGLHTNHKSVRILDGLHIPNELIQMASYSPNFGIPPSNEREETKILNEQLIQIHRITRHTTYPVFASKAQKEFIHRELVETAKNNQHTPTPSQTTIMNINKLATEFLKKNPHIIMNPADKGNINIICLKRTFDTLRDDHITDGINDGTYKQADINTTSISLMTGYLKIIRQLMKDWGIAIEPNMQREMRECIKLDRPPDNPTIRMKLPITYKTALEKHDIVHKPADLIFRPSTMTGLLKVHKPVTKFRPVINTMETIGKPIERWLRKILTHIVDCTNKISVKNSEEVVQKIATNFPRHHLPITHTMHTMDFQSMYTNVPTDEALEILKNILVTIMSYTPPPLQYSQQQPQANKNRDILEDLMMGISIETIINMVKFTTKSNNMFCINDRTFKQNKGLVMGASLSPILANIFLHHKIMKIIEHEHIDGLTILYADDLLHIGDPKDFNKLCNMIELNIPTMPITITKPEDTPTIFRPDVDIWKITRTMSIEFLELKIILKTSNISNSISHHWTAKSYDSGRMMNWNSYTRPAVKRNAIMGKLTKIVKLTTPQHIRNTMDKWFDMAIMADYPPRVLTDYAESALVVLDIKHGATYQQVKKWSRLYSRINHTNAGTNTNQAGTNTNQPQPQQGRRPLLETPQHEEELTPLSYPVITIDQHTPNTTNEMQPPTYARMVHTENHRILQDQINTVAPNIKLATKPSIKNSLKMHQPVNKSTNQHITDVVVTWQCERCVQKFIAIIVDESLATFFDREIPMDFPNATAISGHYGLHKRLPNKPRNFHIISKKGEEGLAKLTDRMLFYIHQNDHIIVGPYLNDKSFPGLFLRAKRMARH